MNYIVMRIGCLCCESLSMIVAKTSSISEAREIARKCNISNTDIFRYNYEVFGFKNENFINEIAIKLIEETDKLFFDDLNRII